MVVSEPAFDYILVGGGLQNGLLTLAIRNRYPSARIALIERGPSLAGNHTWCFHAEDLASEAAALVDPIVRYRWSGYDVRFPHSTRRLNMPYAGTNSSRFDQVVQAVIRSAPHCSLMTDTTVVEIGARHVRLANGTLLLAGAVVDARGPDAGSINDATCGYQKFVGLEVTTTEPHAIEFPVVMDATVKQLDGFRFLYVLPLGPQRLLIEDTRFSDTPSLNVTTLTQAIHDYAATHSFSIAHVERSEHGVLPLPWKGEASPGPDSGPILAGFRGGWFHPTTGYSFPIAAQLAMTLSATTVQNAHAAAEHLAKKINSQRRYCHTLNKMMFNWFAPDQRFHVLERFYTLPPPLIKRFYAMRLSALDRARIVVGRPPKGMSWRAALFGTKR